MNTTDTTTTASAQPENVDFRTIADACFAATIATNNGETLSQFADRIIADELRATAKNGDAWTGETNGDWSIYQDQQGNLYESREKPAYRLPIVINRYSDQQNP